MSINYHKKYNVLIEALGIISRYYNHYSFENLRLGLQKKSSYTNDMEYVIGIMEKVYKEIIEDVDLPQEFSIYFEPIGDSVGIGLADIMLHEALLYHQEENIIKYASQHFHEDSTEFIHALFDGNESIQLDNTPQWLMKELERMQVSDSIKWKIWCVYTNFDEYLIKLMSIVQPVVDKVKEVYPKYEDKFDKFHQFWEKACEEGNFSEVLFNCTNVSISQMDNVNVFPNYMMCNSVRLVTSSSNQVTLFLGLLFQGKNFIAGESFSREEILTRLKLLSDASKYELMMSLKDEPKYGSQLVDHMNLSAATISHHVNSLCSHGLLNIEKHSNRVYYRLNKQQVEYLIDAIRKDLLEDM